ncbi:AAA family ATPase [Tropicimonas sp. S265A]|uniref:AAA family ATPase n=1 Tax=Tropicimonas sp. S265A TaxID=3415134 RepID=UPI003C7D5789
MPNSSVTLHLLCGKVASGKSTLAKRLARADGTVLISEDAWLDALFGEEMASLSDYVRCTSKLRNAMGPHVTALLRAGVSVVLDFQANTVETRKWMRGLLDGTHAEHKLHILDVPDEVCIARLHARNAEGAHPFAVSDAQFRQVTKHFAFPSAGEGFNLVWNGSGAPGTNTDHR